MDRSPEDLANAALGYLSRDTVRSLDGTSPGAIQTKAFWKDAMLEVIGAYDWPECRVVAKLIQVPEVDTAGWAYAYALPSDCEKIWYVGNQRNNLVSVPYERGMSSDPLSTTNYIFSDSAGLYIRYGSQRVTLSRWSAQVFDLIALVLARKCCMTITKNEKLLQLVINLYKAKLSEVKTSVANSEPEVVDMDFTPESISVRSS